MKGRSRKQIKKLRQQQAVREFQLVKKQAAKLHLELSVSKSGKIFTVNRKSGAWLGKYRQDGSSNHSLIDSPKYASLEEINSFLNGYQIALHEGVAEKEMLG